MGAAIVGAIHAVRVKLFYLWRILVPDKKSPKMDRVRRPDGSLTDMVNLTRACDAAQSVLSPRMVQIIAGLAAQSFRVRWFLRN
jgi:hypothetical protein